MEVEAVKQAFLSAQCPGVPVRLREKTARATHRPPRSRDSGGTCVGVFAARGIRVDEDLGEYSGEPTRLSAGVKLSSFAFQLSDRVAVDPAALNGRHQDPLRLSQACITHFVDQPQPQQRCTARFMIDLETSRVTLRSIVEMEEGDEVLASYGGCRPRSGQHVINDAQCSRFAPMVKLTRTEQQRLSLVAQFVAASGVLTEGSLKPEAGKGNSAAVQVRVVQRVAPVVRRRLVKPVEASRPRTIDRWTREEIEELAGLILRHGSGQWENKVAALTTSLPGVSRTAAAAAYVWHAKLKSQKRFAHLLESGSVHADGTPVGWSNEERKNLIDLITERGAHRRDWAEKAKLLGTGRTANAVKLYYHRNIRPGLQASSEAVPTRVGPPEILDMKAEGGRKLYLTTLQAPTISSRGRRLKSVSHPDLVETDASVDVPESKWWATAEELIERVGTENAEAMISKLIEFAKDSCAPSLASEDSDDDFPTGQSNWNYQVWKADQPPSREHSTQHGARAQRERRLPDTLGAMSSTGAHNCDDDDSDSDDVPISALAGARLSPSAPVSSFPAAQDRFTSVPSRKRRTWTKDELSKLSELVQQFGEGDWDSKAVKLGTGRTAKSLEMKHYALQNESAHSQGDRDDGKLEVEVGDATAVETTLGLTEHSQRPVENATSAKQTDKSKADGCFAVGSTNVIQNPISTSNSVKDDIVAVTESASAPNASKSQTAPAEEELHEDTRQHGVPCDSAVQSVVYQTLPGSCSDEIQVEKNAEQRKLSHHDEDEEGEHEDVEEVQEEKATKGKREIQMGHEEARPKLIHPTADRSAIADSVTTSKRGSQIVDTGAADASTLSDPKSPPPSRVGVQSLLSDSDSPELLDGSPSPVDGIETGADDDTPAAQAAAVTSAAAYDTSNTGLLEGEMVNPTSSTHALPTASVAKRIDNKPVSWKVRQLQMNEDAVDENPRIKTETDDTKVAEEATRGRKRERGVDQRPDEKQALARRQLARRERKKPAAHARVANDASWWDAQSHEAVLKRAKVIHHSTRGSPPLGGQARKSSGAGGAARGR